MSPEHDTKVDVQGQDIDVLQGLTAKEAIDTLEGEFAEGNMPDVELFTFPGPVAESFYWSDDSILGIQGPVGSGKTTTLLKSRLRRAIMMPRSVIDGKRRYKLVAVRQTYRDLWSTTIPSYLEVFPKEIGTWAGGRGDPVTHTINFEDEFGPIEFVTEFKAFGDDVEGSMRGIQTTDMWLNETDTVPVDVITVGVGRINRYPKREHFAGLPIALQSYGQIVGDFNAPEEDNWAFGVFHNKEKRLEMGVVLSAKLPEGAKAVTIEFFNQPGYGEPGCENLQNLAPGYYETQLALNTLAGRGDTNDRLVRNKVTYLRVGEPVWQREFKRRIHVSDRPLDAVKGVKLRIGLDQGFKAAAVVAQCLDNYRWLILGELHFPKERLMGMVFGQRLREYIDLNWPGFEVEAGWADMAGEHGSSQAADENQTWNLHVRQASGYRIRPQRIGTNRLGPRLEGVRAALEAPLHGGRPGLLIDPRCTFLIRGFEARYVWTEEVDKSGDKRKIPDKSFTEANVHDALQYLVLSEHSGDGSSPYSKSIPAQQLAQMGHNGGPSLNGDSGGLSSNWDVLSPYN